MLPSSNGLTPLESATMFEWKVNDRLAQLWLLENILSIWNSSKKSQQRPRESETVVVTAFL